MNKIDIGVDKDDLRYVLKILYQGGKLSEPEYKKALDKISAYKIPMERYE